MPRARRRPKDSTPVRRGAGNNALGIFLRRALRIQAAYFASLQHARAGQDEGGGAHRYFLLLRHLPYCVECFAHDAGQAAVDLFFGPEEAREVLCPLEVADGHAAGIGQHVWHDQYATVGQDVVGSWQGRAVGAFQDDLGADFMCALGGDLLFQRGRDQDVALDTPEIFAWQECFGAREAFNAACFGHVGQQARNIQAASVHHGGLVVLYGDDFCAGFSEHACSHAAHVTETLHDHFRAFDRHADLGGGIATDHVHATAGRIAATQAAAQRNWFTGHHASRHIAADHGVAVHHPRHDLFIGVDVWCRNILVRADDHADLARVATGQALQLTFRQGLRIDTDTAFGAAVWHVDCCILDRHPGRQGHHFRQGHVLVEAHAALARAARQIVLHAVAFVVGDGAVIALDRYVDRQDALWTLQRFYPARQVAQVRRNAVDLLEVDAPWAQVFRIEVGRKCLLAGHA